MRNLGIALMLLVAVPAQASVHSDFVKIWDARDSTYRAERAALDANAEASAGRAIEALVAGDAAAADDLELALTAAWSLSELVARGQTLWELREHMATKPSAALSEVWVQGKFDEARRRQTDADLIERQLQVLRSRDRISVQQWIAALERLTMMRGAISGSASELMLIDQNLRSYYRAKGQEPSGLLGELVDKLQSLGNAAREKHRNVQQRSADCARGQCAAY